MSAHATNAWSHEATEKVLREAADFETYAIAMRRELAHALEDRDAARAAGAELQQKLAGILERVTALEPRIAEISAERDAAIEERVRYERAHDLVSRQLGAVARERDAYSEQIEKGGAIYQPLLDDQTDELDRMLSGLPEDDVIRRLK